MLALWTALTCVFDDGRLGLDNNRPSALLAGSWSGARTTSLLAPAEAPRAAALYSLIESAKLNGLDPESYLRESWRASPITPPPASLTRSLGSGPL